MSIQDHDTGPSGVTVDELVEKMFPYIEDLLRRLEGDEFTTNEFIDIMQQDLFGRAYDYVRQHY